MGGKPNYGSPETYGRNNWVHFSAACDPISKTITFYKNGIKDQVVTTGDFENCTGPFRIGGHKNNRAYWNGFIDELYLYIGILNEKEIVDVMNNVKGVEPSDPENPTIIYMPSGKEIFIIYDSKNKLLKIQGEIKINKINIYSKRTIA